MPQIDVCRSCSAPIYDVDGVAGACACTNGMYQALAVRQRLANQGFVRVASAPPKPSARAEAGLLPNRNGDQLPPLDPNWFLSPAEQRVLQVATQERNIPQRRPERHGSVMTDDATEGFNNLNLADAPPSNSDEITFDMPDAGDFSFDTREASTAPLRPYQAANHERFNVMNPPRHEPFTAVRAPSPQGGNMQEVGRVAGGRFPVLRELAATSRPPLPEPVRESRPDPRRPTAAALNRAQAEKALSQAPSKSLPTAYDRIAGDFLKDADAFD